MSIPGIIIAVTLHEYIKSLTAYKLGDTNLRNQGRLAFNPLKHMDVLGGIFMLLFGYGWGNPVRFSPFSFTDRKKGMIIIFVMPFLFNILLGAVFFFAYRLFLTNIDLFTFFNHQILIIISGILLRAVIFNISFAFFNLIPIYPLDGVHLVSAFAPMFGVKIAQREKVLQILLAFFIIFGFAERVFGPLVRLILGALIF